MTLAALAAVLVTGIVGGRSTTYLDLSAGSKEVRYSLFQQVIYRVDAPTRFSRRFGIRVATSADWVPVMSCTMYSSRSPHYQYHGSDVLLDEFVVRCESEQIPLREQVRLAEGMLVLLQQKDFESAASLAFCE